MKKLQMVLLAAAVLAALLAGCGKEETPETEKPAIQAETVPVVTKQPAAPETLPAPEETEAPTEAVTEPAETEPEETEAEEEEQQTDGLRPEFKEAMDAYEAFMNEYADFMAEYKENGNPITMLADYGKFLGEYAEAVEKFDEWDDGTLSNEETKYYIEVQTRVNQKLIDLLGSMPE